MRLFIALLSCSLSFGCSGSANTPKPNVNGSNTAANTAKAGPLPVYGYEIVKAYPHDGNAFTQGLVFHKGFLYESTGEYGESTLRKVEIETGKVHQKVDIPKSDFAEGITLLDGKIYQITWREGICRVFDVNDLKLIREFNYQGEGWGITNDGTNLYMTDSTHVMRILNPETFKSSKMIAVMREDGRPLMSLNELEFVKGEIWANIWHSEKPESVGKANYIARIDPATGKIVGWIDLAGISPDDARRDTENVLNGIAYDPASDRLFVTGKNWKKLFEIKITGPKA
ncbi:MAG: glutaminyl-peptide cyclotransferase [Pyrinomonadaceae bacterium]